MAESMIARSMALASPTASASRDAGLRPPLAPELRPRTLDLNSTWSTMARVAALRSVTADRQRSPVSSSNIDTGWPGMMVEIACL